MKTFALLSNGKKSFYLFSILLFLLNTSLFADKSIKTGPIITSAFWAGMYVKESSLKEETWEYGSFDPSDILLKMKISNNMQKITIRTKVKIKIGDIKISKKTGIDSNFVKQTAKWNESQIVDEKTVNNKEFNYKYIYYLDKIMIGYPKQNKWPDTLMFIVEIYDSNMNIIEKKVKKIIFIPNLSED